MCEPEISFGQYPVNENTKICNRYVFQKILLFGTPFRTGVTHSYTTGKLYAPVYHVICLLRLLHE